MSQVIEQAERRSASRACVTYVLAAAVLAASIASVGAPRRDPATLAMWICLVALVGLSLSPWPARLGGRALARLMEDEVTRDHRRRALEAGFWAAVLSGIGSVSAATWGELSGPDVGRVILGAAMVAALGAFATLELRAAR